MTKLPNVLELTAWYEANKDKLQPPVCNALPFGAESEFQVMAVGGPNERNDFHWEDHEEFFLQLRGSMTLRVIDSFDAEGRPTVRDIEVGEGSMFLLPKQVWHSPQRVANSFGLVIELGRAATDLDKLQWFCEKCRKSAHVVTVEQLTDLSTQLAPKIKEWKDSEKKCPHCNHLNESCYVPSGPPPA